MHMKNLILTVIPICLICSLAEAELKEFVYDDSLRSYVAYVPELAPDPVGYPLVIGLHGTSSNAYQFIANAQLILKANQENFILACPNALLHNFFTYFNAGGGYEQLTAGTDDLGFIAAVIDSMITAYPVDTTRIYAMGHSNGGMMAYRLAAELSQRIAAIGANSGQMVLEDCNPEFPVPIIHMHGLSDSLAPYGGTGDSIMVVPPVDSVLAIWCGINNCSTIPDTIYEDVENGVIGKRWNSASGEHDIQLYTIASGGHHWPREIDSHISATDKFWDFLKVHNNRNFTTGLVASYPFNGNANDTSGNGNDGAVHGAELTQDRYNNQNSAYSFDGIDDYIEIPNSASLTLLEDLTIISWIRMEVLKPFNNIVRKGADNAGPDQCSYAFYVRTSDELAFFFSGGNIHQTSGFNLETEHWYFTAAVFNNEQDSVKLFIDGNKVYSGAETHSPTEYDFPLGIGKTNDPGQYFDGIIDDVRLYNKAFTNLEIKQLFQQESYLQHPQNIRIIVESGTVLIFWDEVAGANSYSVYSSPHPGGIPGNWILEAEGIDNTSWSEPTEEIKKFYFIKAVY